MKICQVCRKRKATQKRVYRCCSACQDLLDKGSVEGMRKFVIGFRRFQAIRGASPN